MTDTTQPSRPALPPEIPLADGVPVYCSFRRLVPVGDLRRHPRNPNKHPPEQVRLLAQIIRAHGWRHPITVSDRSGLMVAGHGRLDAALLAGLSVIPVDFQHFPTEAEEIDVLVADNRIAELSEWDEIGAAAIVQEKLDAGGDVGDLGFTVEAAEEFIEEMAPEEPTNDADAPPQMSRADELQQKWGTALGQIWRLGEHRLMCGDSAVAADVAILMADDKAALFATDPPYGVAYGVETGGDKFDAIANDESDGPRLQAFLEAVFRAAIPHLNDDAAWYLWHAQLTQGFFAAAAAAAAAAAVLIHRQIIWVKPSLVLRHGDYHWRHELCFYGWRKGFRPPWYGDRSQTTVWEVGRENDGVHPTQKPVELFRRPMDFNTRPGEICYEPFSGSGSQIIAAEQTGRRCRAMEIHPGYAAVAIQRWADATGRTPERIDGMPSDDLAAI